MYKLDTADITISVEQFNEIILAYGQLIGEFREEELLQISDVHFEDGEVHIVAHIVTPELN